MGSPGGQGRCNEYIVQDLPPYTQERHCSRPDVPFATAANTSFWICHEENHAAKQQCPFLVLAAATNTLFRNWPDMSWHTLGATIAASRVPGVHLQQLTPGRCNEYIVQELAHSTMSTLMAARHPNIHLALVRGLRRIHHSRSGLDRSGPVQARACPWRQGVRGGRRAPGGEWALGAGRREVREKSQAPPAPPTHPHPHTENCYPALREDNYAMHGSLEGLVGEA